MASVLTIEVTDMGTSCGCCVDGWREGGTGAPCSASRWNNRRTGLRIIREDQTESSNDLCAGIKPLVCNVVHDAAFRSLQAASVNLAGVTNKSPHSLAQSCQAAVTIS